MMLGPGQAGDRHTGGEQWLGSIICFFMPFPLSQGVGINTERKDTGEDSQGRDGRGV